MTLRAPAFWRTNGAASSLLAPVGALYGARAARQLAQDAPRAALPAIVVGGLTMGGDGKTPLVAALAAQLAAQGETPAILSRGYGRRLRDGRPVIVTPDATADAVGDEPLLLAREGLTIVCADRAASARLARDMGASVVLLDDGFHSRHIAPDLALLVIDGDYGAGNGHCTPAGPLRAPLTAQMARADALVVVGAGAAGAALAADADKTVFHARVATALNPALKGARVVAFAGIARPEKLFGALALSGAEVVASRSFPDHHRWRPREIATLAALARRLDARLITTEKDAVRLPPNGPEIDILPIRLEIAQAPALDAMLSDAVQRARLNRAS